MRLLKCHLGYPMAARETVSGAKCVTAARMALVLRRSAGAWQPQRSRHCHVYLTRLHFFVSHCRWKDCVMETRAASIVVGLYICHRAALWAHLKQPLWQLRSVLYPSLFCNLRRSTNLPWNSQVQFVAIAGVQTADQCFATCGVCWMRG